MSAKIEELLAVLDLPEEKQIAELRNYLPNEKWLIPMDCEHSQHRIRMADLAFRLRDEIYSLQNGGDLLAKGIFNVLKKIAPNYSIKYNCSEHWCWWICCAIPIHWIIAALITKELLVKK